MKRKYKHDYYEHTEELSHKKLSEKKELENSQSISQFKRLPETDAEKPNSSESKEFGSPHEATKEPHSEIANQTNEPSNANFYESTNHPSKEFPARFPLQNMNEEDYMQSDNYSDGEYPQYSENDLAVQGTKWYPDFAFDEARAYGANSPKPASFVDLPLSCPAVFMPSFGFCEGTGLVEQSEDELGLSAVANYES